MTTEAPAANTRNPCCDFDLEMINNAITIRKNRFIAIHSILSEPIVIPSNNENNITCIRNRNILCSHTTNI